MTSVDETGAIPHEDVLAVIERTDTPHAPVTASDVADELECTRRTAYNKLSELADRDQLRTKKIGARARVWWRPHAATEDEDRTADEPRDQQADDRHDLVNSVVRTVSREIVAAETRTDIVQAACTTLAASDAFQFAVAGEFSPSYDHFITWAHDGIGEGYLQTILEASDDRSLEDGLGARATKTGDLQVAQNLTELPDEFWSAAAAEHGFASYAAVPLVYKELVYGVLGVFASEPGAFDEGEQEILRELGEMVGHAINALERRKALVADEVLEVEFKSAALAEPFIEAGLGDGSLTVDTVIPLPDGTQLQYATVETPDIDDLQPYLDALLELPTVTAVRTLERASGKTRIEFHVDGTGLAQTVASYGGRLTHMAFEDDAVRITAELPRHRSVRNVLTAMRSAAPDLTFSRQRTRRRDAKPPIELRTAVDERLTDRQQSALEAAYFAGYFDWPRKTTGQALAAKLDVSPPTFHNHLRKGQRTVFELLLDDDPTDHAK